MTAVWRIATDAPGYTADDLTGAGAKLSGGRWNRPGSAMLYCARNISLAPPPVGWDAIPAGKLSLDEGERWLKSGRSAVLIVPSAIVDEECNVLINPLRPGAREIAARKLRKWTYDPRLMRSPA